jgi:hypothetical protein
MATIYRKIPRVGTGRFGFQALVRSRMYESPDHLLVIYSTGYTEEYKRIFYRDIRYVDIRPSSVQAVQAAVSAGIAALLALLFFVAPPVVALLLMTPFVIWFLVNLALGPVVKCFVTTNVQSLRLPTPRRRNQVGPFLAFVRERAGALSAAPQPGVAAVA